MRDKDRFVYQRTTADYNQRRQQFRALSSGLSGARDSFVRQDVKFFKPAVGVNRVRILPATWKDAKHYGYDVYIHYSIGQDNSAYLCLKRMKKGPCPVCLKKEEAERSGDAKLAAEFKATYRVLVWCLNRQDNDGPKLWAMPPSIERDIFSSSEDTDGGGVLFIENFKEGYDIEFTREGDGFNTKYRAARPVRRSTVAGDDSVLDFIIDNPLPSLLVYHSYEHIERVLSGNPLLDQEETETPSWDNENASAPRTSRSASVTNSDRSSGIRHRLSAMSLPDMIEFAGSRGLAVPDEVKDEDVLDYIVSNLNDDV